MFYLVFIISASFYIYSIFSSRTVKLSLVIFQRHKISILFYVVSSKVLKTELCLDEFLLENHHCEDTFRGYDLVSGFRSESGIMSTSVLTITERPVCVCVL